MLKFNTIISELRWMDFMGILLDCQIRFLQNHKANEIDSQNIVCYSLDRF